MSLREISSPIYFFIIADTFCTASLAILPSFPVATTFPSALEPAGVTSATIGKIKPEYSLNDGSALITASPFTVPTFAPSVSKYL